LGGERPFHGEGLYSTACRRERISNAVLQAFVIRPQFRDLALKGGVVGVKDIIPVIVSFGESVGVTIPADNDLKALNHHSILE
jgi:hypothetical protein